MEKNPETSEKKKEESSSENRRDKTNVWFQENLRMLVSIVIVVLIAGGIYAYSKRTQAPLTTNDSNVSSESSEGKISVIGGDTTKEESQTGEKNTTAPAVDAQKPAETTPPPATDIQTSKETGGSFVETAVKGDSTTKLARRALANYLEKNPDTSLSAEHKIYIEDFLRRQVGNGRLKVGESKEFTKDAITKAVEKSKGLSEKQLKNLQKYAQRVPGLK